MKFTLKYFWVILFATHNSNCIFGQSFINDSKDSLIFWAEVMHKSEVPKFRIEASKIVNQLIYQNAEKLWNDSSYYFPGLVVVTSPDSMFKILTWQFQSSPYQWQYGGIILLPESKLMTLNYEKRDYVKIRREQFQADHWYGALYYQVIPKVFDKNNPYYILFGFAQNHRREKFKIIDAVYFKPDSVSFGFKNLVLKDETSEEFSANRQIIRYSQNANCALEFDGDQDRITFDHIARIENPRESTILYIPDGTYENLYLEQNQWKHELKMENIILKEAPREKPILDQRPKDLFGKEKK